MADLEALYGECWRKLARLEGHRSYMPPTLKKHVQPTTEGVERRRDRIVCYVSRNPDLKASELRRSLRLKKDTFSNDMGALVYSGRVQYRTDQSNARRYFV